MVISLSRDGGGGKRRGKRLKGNKTRYILPVFSSFENEDCTIPQTCLMDDKLTTTHQATTLR